MIVSYKLLNKYVDLKGIDPFELGDILTNAGLEVENVRALAQGSDLVIGYVKEAYPHPNSDKLTVCLTDVGNETLKICCGAKNVGQDMYVIVARPGCQLDYAKVPVIKKVTLGGVESNGMICSLSEIGIPSKFQTHEQLAGIEVLDHEYQLGAEALKTLGYNDFILDISLTPNRSDIYSIYALAIEVAGLLNTTLFDVEQNIEQKQEGLYHINIESEDCLSYGLFTFTNLNAQEGSYENKIMLYALGFKPRFNIVDDGNMAMVISGNPVHTFDADKLKSKKFIIKKGLEEEHFLALDDKEYQITKDDLLIINGDEIVAIAGVIGSKSSCIDENTKNIVVESAAFSHVSVRNTARRLDLFSEASVRFSKIVNSYTLEFPIKIMEELLNVKCDAINKVNYLKYEAKPIKLTHEKITKVLGITIAFEECVAILRRLSFKVEIEDSTLIAYPPSYRKDVEIDVDLIEEIIRVYGYENIIASLPLQEINDHPLSNIQTLVNHTKKLLNDFGLNEIITYQLSNARKLDQFSLEKNYKELYNPLNNERMIYRDNLLTSLVECIEYNKSYQINDQQLFEISHVFVDNKEKTYLSLGLIGNYYQGNWHNQALKADFYIMKALIFDWLAKLGFYYGRVLIEPVAKDHPFLHPKKSAYITMNKKIIGVFGQLHPRLAQEKKLNECLIAQIDLSLLSTNKGRINKYEGLSLIPSVYRDLSLIVPNDIYANEIIKVVKQGNNKLIKDVKIFDLYYGQELPEHTYSMALSLEIGNDNENLNELEINNLINKVLKELQNKLNIILRN
ncbi:MAG: phenylalanine--tRNA ligase subunit beta [Bacilli bacterium]|jgi:phenylalanyl-tRNA synthetase beta chain|nr:phenylalanine--tRNA ligase subunit beta [Bacilli bacterium]